MAGAAHIMFICAASADLFQEIEQILPVGIFGKALGALLQVCGSDPATRISDLFGAADLKALAL